MLYFGNQCGIHSRIKVHHEATQSLPLPCYLLRLSSKSLSFLRPSKIPSNSTSGFLTEIVWRIFFFFSQLFLLVGGWFFFFFFKHKMIWKPWGAFMGEKQQNAHGRKNLRRVFASDICARSWRKWWTQIHKKEQQGNSAEGNRIKKIHD